MTKEVFSECMVILQGVFGSIESERSKGLFVALIDMSDKDIKLATKRIIKVFRPTSTVPFPVPSDFYDAAGKSAKNTAHELMGLIQDAVFSVGSYRSVDFGSPELHGVIQRFGGWPTICQWGQREWDINEGRFLAALEHALSCEDKGAQYLVGIAEAQNGNGKFSGLCYVSRNESGKIMIKDGLHPSTKLFNNTESQRLISKLADKFSVTK